MITLAHLRSLLERALTHAENPAIVRLSDRTVEGLALAYLPRTFSVVPTPSFNASTFHAVSAQVKLWHASRRLDLTDPGTAHALLVALALALGMDPGAGGLGCMWVRDEPGWSVVVERGDVRFTDPLAIRRRGDPTQITAHLVAREPDPIKALALAALHVLEHP